MVLSENLLNMRTCDNPTEADIERLAMKLSSVIVDPAKQAGLCKKMKNNKNYKPRLNPRKPWFNEGCEKKRRIFLAAKNSVWKAKSEEEKEQCVQKTKLKGREYKIFISQRQKTFNKDLQKNLRGLKKQHPKEYWKILNDSNGNQKRDPKVALEDFEKHFKTLNEKNETTFPEFDPINIDIDSNPEINGDFTLEEVKKNIDALNSNKSEGVDLIKNEYLKNCPQDVIKLIVELFNLILRTGIVPTEWCIGLIIPIFKKKGSPQDTNNYRGVTLLSCLGKLFTSGINVRLTRFANSRSTIGEVHFKIYTTVFTVGPQLASDLILNIKQDIIVYLSITYNGNSILVFCFFFLKY